MRWSSSGDIASPRDGKVCMPSTMPSSSNSRHSGSYSGKVGYLPWAMIGRTKADLKPRLATRRNSSMAKSTFCVGSTAAG